LVAFCRRFNVKFREATELVHNWLGVYDVGVYDAFLAANGWDDLCFKCLRTKSCRTYRQLRREI